jgi:hypothetical protein
MGGEALVNGPRKNFPVKNYDGKYLPVEFAAGIEYSTKNYSTKN